MSIRRIHALFRVAPVVSAFLVAAAASAGDLASDVRVKLKASQLNEANVGYMVIDVATGKTVASHNETIARMPASNMKVLTTGAALDVLGPNFEFRTRLVAANNAGKTTLTIVGDGDPALFDPEAHGGNWTTVSDAVNAWSASLKAAGVTQVVEVVVDARIFDSEPIPAGDEKWATNLNGTYAVAVSYTHLTLPTSP
jgi:D-alanyl-D-alanine carboxypeptidase